MLKNDLYIDGDHGMKAQHEETLTVEADHEEALEMHYGSTRMPYFIAMVDYQEMKSYRAMSPRGAHRVCLDEMAREDC